MRYDPTSWRNSFKLWWKLQRRDWYLWVDCAIIIGGILLLFGTTLGLLHVLNWWLASRGVTLQ